jgi:hypothetical protein
MAIGVISLVVTVIGLGVAFLELRRVGTVADAAARTAARNEKKISEAFALSRVSDLEHLDQALRIAANGRERQQASELVIAWRRAAAEYQAILAAAGVSDTALEEDLELSLGMVDQALKDLGDEATPPADACVFILRHIGSACMRSRRAAAGIMVSTES